MLDERAEQLSVGESTHLIQPSGLVSPEAVRQELAKVLESPEFRSSRRCQDFLRFVVETTLGGRPEILKERTIGIEAFGRPPSYDPSGDATVRVKAGEVRKRLGLYYASEGRGDEVRIDLPPGGYVPDFIIPAPVVEPTEPAVAPPSKVVESFSRRRRLLLVIAALLLVTATAFGWFQLRHPRTVVDEFWSPFLKGATPALICASYVPVYTDREPWREHPQKFEDFIVLNDQFVGGGDLVAATHLVGALTRMGRTYQVRMGNEVSFQDLRTAPAILIGYSYTRWKELNNDLRFFIDASRRPVTVLDYGKPTPWALHNITGDRHTDMDYAIVSRVFHNETHTMTVAVSGITGYGTEAAAELVTNPVLLAEALRDAPKDWQKKNLQFILQVRVISNTPDTPRVIAKHFW